MMMNRRHFLDTLGVGSLVAMAPIAAGAAIGFIGAWYLRRRNRKNR